MKQMIKKDKGITLIALIITIVILVILVGVSVSSITNSGLLDKTKQAAENYNKESAREEVNLSIAELKMENLQEGKNPTLPEFATQLDEKLKIQWEKSTVSPTDNEYIYDIFYKNYYFILNEKYEVLDGENKEDISQKEIDEFLSNVPADFFKYNASTNTITGINSYYLSNNEIVNFEEFQGVLVIPNKLGDTNITQITERAFYRHN